MLIKKYHVFAYILILLFPVFTIAVDDNLTTGITSAGRVLFPLGTSAESYTMGFSGGVEVLFSIISLPYFTGGLDFDYAYIPLNTNQDGFSGDSNLSLITLGPALKAAMPIGNRFSLNAKVHASGFYALLSGSENGSAPGFAFGAGGSIGFILSPWLLLRAGASYESWPGLYSGIAVSIGLTNRITGAGSTAIPRRDFVPNTPGGLPGGGNIRLLDATVNKIYPVLYKYYDTHSIGNVRVVNSSRKYLKDIEVRLKLSQYMDAPKLSASIDHLDPGQEQEVEIFALFNDDILSITEGAKLAGELTVDYRIGESTASDGITFTLETHDRNAIEWDNDQKIAAFITARDEEIQKYARNIASVVRDDGLNGFSREFQLAIALLGAMDLSGCTYVVDPSSSYLELSAAGEVDSVQFPRQTLEYRAGDCDDLAATYTALLESVGVETAFITVPGHIYSAFRINMNPEEAKRAFSKFENLIVLDNDIWIPVETTAFSEGFMNAWGLGARQWRKHFSSGEAILYPTREAWKIYEPVAFSASSYELEIPDREEVSSLFTYDLERYVNQEIASRERGLLARLNRNTDDKRSLNALGVLYARYGRNGEARKQFEKAAKSAYVPALVNLGHMAFMEKDYTGSERYYSQVLEGEPENTGAVLGVARTAYALEQYDRAQKEYERLSALSPQLAARFDYLGDASAGAGRASEDAALSGITVWEEE